MSHLEGDHEPAPATALATRPATERAWVEVDLEAIAHNVRELLRLAAPARLLAVVKADGYGHGAAAVARAAAQAGASYLGVATCTEGIALREAGVTIPILVFGVHGAAEPVEELIRFGLTATVTNVAAAAYLSDTATRRPSGAGDGRVRVHLKVDTGMGRLGVLPEAAADVAEAIARLPGVQLEGIYSHLATAEEPDTGYLQWQARRFAAVLQELERREIRVPLRHLLNTAGLLTAPEWRLDLVRAGLGVVGLYPAPHLQGRMTLRPALRLLTRVAEVRWLPEGSYVSYGRMYQTPSRTRIATLPVGYADGYTRRLSGKGRALIGGRLYPVVGRICMDQCMVDVGQEPVHEGEVACLIGPGDHGEMTVDEAARLSGTISYEFMTQLGARLPRTHRACQES